DSTVRFIELLQDHHLNLSSNDFSLYIHGEPVLPLKFVSLFDSSLPNESNNQELRKRFILYHELDHHCEKFDENLLNFNRYQSTSENERLPELLAPEILQQQTKNDN
ncbi:unnamed protein product, partial [Rotaria sordida]